MKPIYTRISGLLILLMVAAGTNRVQAQLNPLSAIYYQNQYLANPAMAGFNTGLSLNLAYRKQWNTIPGTPSTQAITGDYGFKKVGLGLNLTTDQAGLQTYTHLVGTYAYHIPLNAGNQKLHFGISVGLTSDRIDRQNVQGNTNDVLVGQYNERESYIDGDVGIAYTTGKLNLQGALPNLKSFFNTDANTPTVDRSTVFASAAYQLQFGTEQNGLGLEPKVCFRGIKGWKNIVDIGSNFNFINSKLTMMAVYHSSKSTSFGAGIKYHAILISGIYTNEPAALKGNTSGDFEVNVKVKLF